MRLGWKSNHTDFIRSAIRSQLDKHAVEAQQSVTHPRSRFSAFFRLATCWSTTALKRGQLFCPRTRAPGARAGVCANLRQSKPNSRRLA
ncbi:MAG: hypothetical protein AB1649_27835 [Chloroflexota bacterium]